MEYSLYKSIIDKSSIGYAYHELIFNESGEACDYIFLEVNNAFEKLTGLKSENIIGKKVTEILPDIRTGEVDWVKVYADVTLNNLHKNFKQFAEPLGKDYQINAFSIEKNRFVTLFSNPQENTADFKKLFENMPIGGVIYKVINDGRTEQDYIFLDFNNHSSILEGKSHEEMIGKTIYDLRPYQDIIGLLEVFREVWKTGVSKKFSAEKYIDKNYNNYYDINVFRLSKDTIVALYEDVTEIINWQKELKDKSYKLATYIDKAPYGIFIANKDGNFVEANNEAYTMSGYSAGELIGKSLLNIVANEHKKKAFREFVSLRDVGFLDNNTKYVTKTGQIRWWNIRATKLSEDRYLGFAVDITDKKALEESNINMQMMLQNQQKLQAIGTLASGVAHEINNPINGIMNYSQLIADSTDKDSDNNIYANEIIAETKRIAEIIQSLLQFSRQEKTSYSIANIDDIINSTLMLINSIIKHDSINFTVEIQKNLPQIKCRSQQIQQVILNLITNSIYSLNSKYENDFNKKELLLSAKSINKKGKDYIQLLIKDNGNGIPYEIQNQIFDPFFTTKPKDKGTGLGLAISYGIVKEHDGEIFFNTKENEYTEFYVNLRSGK